MTRTRLEIGLIVFAFAILAGVARADQIQEPAQSAPFGEGGDIRCNINTGGPVPEVKYESTPIRATTYCAGLGKTVVLGPQCPVLAGDEELNSRYNAYVLKSIIFTPPTPSGSLDREVEGYGLAIQHNPNDVRLPLMEYVIDNFLEPFKSKDIRLVIWNSDFRFHAYVDWDVFYGERRPTMLIKDTLFMQYSPAGAISSIGHELVHVLQHQREQVAGTSSALEPSKTPLKKEELDQIGDVLNEFVEIEPRYWQRGIGIPSTTIWPRPFAQRGGELYQCQRPRDKYLIDSNLDCQEWLVASWVHETVADRTNGAKKIALFKQWLEADDWARTVWLPKHSKWARGDSPGKSAYAGCH